MFATISPAPLVNYTPRNVYRRKNGSIWIPNVNPLDLVHRRDTIVQGLQIKCQSGRSPSIELADSRLNSRLRDIKHENGNTLWTTAECFQQGYRLAGVTLGFGAYASVELARVMKFKLQKDVHIATIVDHMGHDQVAVKVIDKCRAMQEYDVKFIDREKSAMQILSNCQRVVTLYEVFESKKRLYLIMEYCEKGDLLTHVNKFKERSGTGLPERQVQRLFLQVCEAVDECHSKGIIHRDLKSENILLDRHMNVKLSDFGFSCPKTKSLLSTYCGSYAYAAPEVVANLDYDGVLADLWSLGVILYVMATGCLPYPELSNLEEAQKMQKLAFPSKIHSGCKTLIKKLLQFDPSKRAALRSVMDDPWLNPRSLLILSIPSTKSEVTASDTQTKSSQTLPNLLRPTRLSSAPTNRRFSSKHRTVTLRKGQGHDAGETVLLKSIQHRRPNGRRSVDGAIESASGDVYVRPLSEGCTKIPPSKPLKKVVILDRSKGLSLEEVLGKREFTKVSTNHHQAGAYPPFASPSQTGTLADSAP